MYRKVLVSVLFNILGTDDDDDDDDDEEEEDEDNDDDHGDGDDDIADDGIIVNRSQIRGAGAYSALLLCRRSRKRKETVDRVQKDLEGKKKRKPKCNKENALFQKGENVMVYVKKKV